MQEPPAPARDESKPTVFYRKRRLLCRHCHRPVIVHEAECSVFFELAAIFSTAPRTWTCPCGAVNEFNYILFSEDFPLAEADLPADAVLIH